MPEISLFGEAALRIYCRFLLLFFPLMNIIKHLVPNNEIIAAQNCLRRPGCVIFIVPLARIGEQDSFRKEGELYLRCNILVF